MPGEGEPHPGAGAGVPRPGAGGRPLAHPPPPTQGSHRGLCCRREPGAWLERPPPVFLRAAGAGRGGQANPAHPPGPPSGCGGPPRSAPAKPSPPSRGGWGGRTSGSPPGCWRPRGPPPLLRGLGPPSRSGPVGPAGRRRANAALRRRLFPTGALADPAGAPAGSPAPPPRALGPPPLGAVGPAPRAEGGRPSAAARPEESGVPAAAAVLAPLREALAACRPTVQVRPRPPPPALPRAREGQQGGACLSWGEESRPWPLGGLPAAPAHSSASRNKCATTSGGG